MRSSKNWIVFDGDIVSADQPVVPAVSRGLMYGDGVFETFRTYESQTLFLQKHLDRLYAGLGVLGISEVSELVINRLRPMVYELLVKKSLTSKDAIVRLQVWRDGQRGYTPDSEANTHFSITASACPDSFTFPHLSTVDVRRIPSASLPSDYKFTNGINYILAAREADEKGADDALMKTTEGHISETTIANVFWAKGDNIFTPSTKCNLIPGITRNSIIRIIEQSENWTLQEGAFGLDHLLDADIVWICNSVRELLPVQQVEGYTFDIENKLLKELQKRYVTRRDSNLKPLNI